MNFLTDTFIVLNRIIYYIAIVNATEPQSFAYHSIIVWLCEVLFRVYTSNGQVYEKTTKRETTDKRTAKK